MQLEAMGLTNCLENSYRNNQHSDELISAIKREKNSLRINHVPADSINTRVCVRTCQKCKFVSDQFGMEWFMFIIFNYLFSAFLFLFHPHNISIFVASLTRARRARSTLFNYVF